MSGDSQWHNFETRELPGLYSPGWKKTGCYCGGDGSCVVHMVFIMTGGV